jgi:hypothetical protein
MKTITRILVGFVALLVACQANKTLEPSREQLGHPNGLRLPPPPGFLRTQTEYGFTLSEGGDLRTPRTIEITRAKEPPAIRQPQTRGLATGATARFSVQEVGSGSAGAQYELRASKQLGSSWIVVVATAQSERGEPDFALAWQLLDSAEISGAD